MSSYWPGDWKSSSLGELFEFSNGINADKSAYGSGVPFANVLEVISNESLEDRMVTGHVDLRRTEIDRYRVRYGDVLFNRTSETPGDVGLSSVYVGNDLIVFGGFVLRGRPYTKDLNTQYAKYAFRAEYVRKQIASYGQGAVRSNIGQRDLRLVRIWMPPESEQVEIASFLDDADRTVELLKQLIAKREAVKQGVVQHLVSAVSHLRGYDGRRSRCKLCDLGPFLKGRGIRRDDSRASGVACFRYGELYTKYDSYTAEPVSFVSPAVAATALPLHQGDLLFAGSGETREEIGVCVAFTGTAHAVAGGDIVVLRALDVNPIYLACLMNTPTVAAKKARLSQGDAIVHINAEALGSLEVDLPQRDEQNAIARIILDADAELEALRARLRKAKAIKQGMMEELLTGRTRLSVAEARAA